MSSGASLTSWGEGASLVLVGHPSSAASAIEIPYGVDVLHRLNSADAYPFLAFSDLNYYLEDTGVGVFWLHCAAW